MALFHKAEKKKAKLRLGITGTAGSGKTYGALLIALGIGGKIALIDTENGSGDLYSSLGNYDVGNIQAPYTVQKYLEAMHEAEQSGYDTIIIDSLSHAWSGEGGLLDMQGKIAASGKGNSYTAWREVTPWHNKLIDSMLSSPCHIIATMRSKTDYIQTENDYGRKEIRKVGLAPVQRDGMDYEFGVVFDISITHVASVSKDRTGLFDSQFFTITKNTGEILRDWLNSGYDPKRVKDIYNRYLVVCDGQKNHAINAMKKIIGDTPSNLLTEEQLQLLENDLTLRENNLNDNEDKSHDEISTENQTLFVPSKILRNSVPVLRGTVRRGKSLALWGGAE